MDKQFKTRCIKQANCEKTDAYQGIIRFLNYASGTIYIMHKNNDIYYKRVRQMAARMQRSYGNEL